MKLYDIFYHGNSFDRNTSLPVVPTGDTEKAVNTNWGHEVLRPKKVDGKLIWWCEKHEKPYQDCSC